MIKLLRHIANLKILKAIHNDRWSIKPLFVVATHREFKNFESNSQHYVRGDGKVLSCDTSRI